MNDRSSRIRKNDSDRISVYRLFRCSFCYSKDKRRMFKKIGIINLFEYIVSVLCIVEGCVNSLVLKKIKILVTNLNIEIHFFSSYHLCAICYRKIRMPVYNL